MKSFVRSEGSPEVPLLMPGKSNSIWIPTLQFLAQSLILSIYARSLAFAYACAAEKTSFDFFFSVSVEII